MNSFTNTILTILLGWVRTLLNAARDFISSDSSTAFFSFFRENWRMLFLLLCIIGVSLDIIVYLVRWRPHSVWRKRRSRHKRKVQSTEDPYEFPPYSTDAPAITTNDYTPVPEAPYGEPTAEPTMQYQIQSRQGGQPMHTAPVTIPYTTPYFAPEANAYQEEIPQLYTHEPVTDQQQRYAFGMAPSFGSAQSEPVYDYQHDAARTFAPPNYSQGLEPAEYYTAPQYPQQVTGDTPPVQPQSFEQPSPYFRPFSDRGPTDFAPPRNKRLNAVAKRARNLLSADEAYENISYKDFQPTVDVSKAFHSPVYPEKKSGDDA